PQGLFLIPLLVLFSLLNTGITLFAARLTVHVRDLTQVLPFVSRILFYSSGVLFDINKIFDAMPWAVAIFDYYPLYQVLQLARCFLMDKPMNPMYWASLCVWSVVVFVGGVIFFWVAEERYGRN
ncbi:MAG: ABC transporter permease, partial [Propionibacteriaceae bacterium]|nr:ABC transporter permease [Propionibacteriaceae bacterium]